MNTPDTSAEAAHDAWVALRRSETEFRAFFEQAAAGAIQVSLDGTLARVNRRFCDILGYTASELLGQSVFDLTHPDDRALSAENMDRVLVGGGSDFAYEKRFLHKDGRSIWVEAAVTLIRDATGAPSHWQAVVLDISRRKSAEEAVRRAREIAERSRAQLHAIFSSMTEGVAVFDAAGSLLEINPAGLAMHGLDRALMMTAGLKGLMKLVELRDKDGRILPLAEWPVSRALQGESFTGFEARVSRVDGSGAFIGSYAAAPVRDSEGRIVMAVATLRDVTAQKQAEEIARTAREELARANEALERRVEERTAKLRETVAELEHFSYTITHDMRAPLRAMQAFGQLLHEEHADSLNATGKDFLRRIVEAAIRMDHLITDALNYSEVVQTELTLEPVDPGPLLRGIIDSYLEFQPPLAEITLADELPKVLGNRAGLTQCFSNLIGNAVKFVKSGARPEMRIWGEERGDTVRLWFEDNGIGIAPEHHERIFEMFHRVSRTHDGTGIGLALVRKVVERMRGRVGVESAPGEGSRFWIELGKG